MKTMTPADWIALAALAAPLWRMAVGIGKMGETLERASKAIESLESRVRDIEESMPKPRGWR